MCVCVLYVCIFTVLPSWRNKQIIMPSAIFKLLSHILGLRTSTANVCAEFLVTNKSNITKMKCTPAGTHIYKSHLWPCVANK